MFKHKQTRKASVHHRVHRSSVWSSKQLQRWDPFTICPHTHKRSPQPNVDKWPGHCRTAWNCMIREQIWDVWNYLLNAYSLSNEPQALRFSLTLYCASLMIQHTHGHILSLLTSNSAERNAPWVRSDDDVLCVSFFVVLALFLLTVSWLRLSCRVLCCTLLAGI